jgi:hypothetical protein
MATQVIDRELALQAQTEMAETLSDMAGIVVDSPCKAIREQSEAWRAFFARIIRENHAGRLVDLAALTAPESSCRPNQFCPIRGK